MRTLLLTTLLFFSACATRQPTPPVDQSAVDGASTEPLCLIPCQIAHQLGLDAPATKIPCAPDAPACLFDRCADRDAGADPWVCQ